MTQALSTSNTIEFTATQTAAEIKKMLKKSYKDVKWSVTTRHGSINIEWIDGPSMKTVEHLTRIFEGAEMVQNGADSIKGYKGDVDYKGQKIRFGVSFIFHNRFFSEEIQKIVDRYACDKWGGDYPLDKYKMTPLNVEREIHRIRQEMDASEMTSLVYHAIEAKATPVVEVPVAVESQEKETANLAPEESGIVSTPMQPQTYLIREEANPVTRGPRSYFRVYRLDGTPLYMGDASLEAVEKRLRAYTLVSDIRVEYLYSQESPQQTPLFTEEETPDIHVEIINHRESVIESVDLFIAHIERLHQELDTLTQKAIPLEQKIEQQETVLNSHLSQPQNTLKGEAVNAHVLDILQQCSIVENVVTLPSVRLDRKLYVEVNEVLERIGGKWNRKAKGHVFEIDPTELFNLVLATQEMPPKNPTAYFPTPTALAQRLLEESTFYGIPSDATRILEPSAGTGNIASVMRDYCRLHGIKAQLNCCEIVPAYADKLRTQGFTIVASDFLSYEVLETERYHAIIANPPFSIEGDALAYVTHIEHMWSMLAPHGVLTAIVPGGFAFRNDTRIVRLRELVERYGSWHTLEQDAFKASGTGVNTCVITLKKEV